jgi:hypothetical protein
VTVPITIHHEVVNPLSTKNDTSIGVTITDNSKDKKSDISNDNDDDDKSSDDDNKKKRKLLVTLVNNKTLTNKIEKQVQHNNQVLASV